MRRPELLCLLLLVAGCSSGGGERAEAPTRQKSLSASGRTNLGLAEGYLRGGDGAQAMKRAQLALKSDPGSAEVHALLGMIHEREGATEKARREFDRALQIAPTDGNILNAHASWLCQHGQADQADREFALALADRSYQAPVHALSNAGKCALSAGRLAAAEHYLRRALVFAPSDRNLLFLLADVELRQGKLFEAQAFVQRRDGLGSDAATLDLAARIEDAAGNAHGAARYRQRLQNEFPNYVPTGEGARSP
jgi:type IV pilus assembly protein PilF